MRAAFNPEAETQMHEGGWRGQWSWRVALLPWWQFAGFIFGGIWWNGGLMVLGMGLMGLGGLIAVIGGLMFLVVVVGAIARRRTVSTASRSA